MRKILISFTKPASSIVACSLLLLPALHGQQARGAVGAGASVYGTMCGRCHNPRSPLERSDREWVTIANHMRVRGNLTGPEVRAVLAFLQATNTDPLERTPLPPQEMPAPEAPAVATGPVSTDPAVIAQGEVLVAEKACIGCHVIGRQGGPVGPGLNGVVSRKGAVFVRQKLTTPAFDNATSMMPNFGLTPEQVEAITAYLATLGGG
jgi:mono/diheme cytochrome c family protein